MNHPKFEVKVSGNKMIIEIEDLPPNLQDQLVPVLKETLQRLSNPHKGDIAIAFVE